MDLERKTRLVGVRRDVLPNGSGVMKEVQFKFLVIGDFGVGKTAIVRRYMDGEYKIIKIHRIKLSIECGVGVRVPLIIVDSDAGLQDMGKYGMRGRFSSNYKITIGADFSLKTIPWDKNTRVSLQVWDIAGHEKFGYMTRVYYKYAVAAVVVFDLTRSATVHSVSKWLQDLREKVMLIDGSPVPVVLLANKCDVPGCVVPTDVINRLCKTYSIDAWYPTSAKDNVNIDEAFQFLMKQSFHFSHLETMNRESIVLNKRPIFDKKIYEKNSPCCI